MRRLLQVLAVLVVLCALAAGGLAWWGNQWLQQPLSGLQERTTFEVPRGAHMRSVAATLRM
jgi:cell division protein YceG involved in septum cleavage